MLHIALHFLVPLVLAAALYPKSIRKHYLLMLSGLIIDLDHLLANPIYDATRCSVGFHPLHGGIPLLFYVAALAHPKTRAVGVGLCIHIALDSFDCKLSNGVWFVG